MEIYLVRHGQTEYNRKRIHQPNEARLTEAGRQQAHKVVEQLRALQPTYLINSPMRRAKETADIINAALELPREENSLFEELHRPNWIVGRGYVSFASFVYIVRWFSSLRHRADQAAIGESRRAFLSRIKAAQHFLERRPANERLVIVTHSIFIDFFTHHIRHETPVSFFRAVLLLLKLRRVKNASLTHVRFESDSTSGRNRWQLVKMGEINIALESAVES